MVKIVSSIAVFILAGILIPLNRLALFILWRLALTASLGRPALQACERVVGAAQTPARETESRRALPARQSKSDASPPTPQVYYRVRNPPDGAVRRFVNHVLRSRNLRARIRETRRQGQSTREKLSGPYIAPPAPDDSRSMLSRVEWVRHLSVTTTCCARES